MAAELHLVKPCDEHGNIECNGADLGECNGGSVEVLDPKRVAVTFERGDRSVASRLTVQDILDALAQEPT